MNQEKARAKRNTIQELMNIEKLNLSTVQLKRVMDIEKCQDMNLQILGNLIFMMREDPKMIDMKNLKR